MKDALTFGDVFLYEERQYIFFLESNGVFYCGRILNDGEKGRVIALFNRQSERIRHDHIVFCFVTLTTETVNNAIAHLAHSDTNIPSLPPYLIYVCSLNAEDQHAIREKIAKASGIPIALKKYIASL